MMSNIDRLAYMANQIAKNLAAQGHDFAVAATADHIQSFWDPRMKTQILDVLKEGYPKLDDIARDAVVLLRDGSVADQQTRATKFNSVDEVGRSDAG